MQTSPRRPGSLKYALVIAGINTGTLAVTDICSAADVLSPVPAPRQVISHAGTCAHQHVLSRANYHFTYQVRHVPQLPHVRIKSFTNIMQTGYEPALTRYNITRHYCTAIANMDNGTNYPVAYVISENQGYAGAGGIDVDFCVDGFDRWRVHDNACRSLR